MLDATAGIDSPDVQARLVRAVLGATVVGDSEIDVAMQEALQARQNELEAANVLPELAKRLDPLREKPIRKVEISFNHKALARDTVLPVGLEFDKLFSQPMWFLFAHYREGCTWPQWMSFQELDHSGVRSDGKRIDGRFQWFDRINLLSENLDGTDLRDLPATFGFEFSGETWQPGGSIATYEGGPTVPNLGQKMEIPALASLIDKSAQFSATLVRWERDAGKAVGEEENDLYIREVAQYESGDRITLYRSAHGPMERAILKGVYLSGQPSAIEREAILGLYPRVSELAAAERMQRRRAGEELLEKPMDQLSPEERRVVATLRYRQAQLDMFRVFANAPPPGPARQRLHETALRECWDVWQLLQPIVASQPTLDDFGTAYWAAGNMGHYFQASGAPDKAMPYVEAALTLAADASAKDPDEPEYRRWTASAFERLAEVQAAAGELENAITSLKEAVEETRLLYEQLSNDARRRDLEERLRKAIKLAGSWKRTDASQQKWREWLSELRPAQSATAH